MKNKLNEAISRSVKTGISSKVDNSLADQLVKNADKALGIIDEPEHKKVIPTKNLTFSFSVDDVKNINTQVERFLMNGKNVSKSELMRIGLALIEQTNDKDLANLTSLIIKRPRGRQS